MTDGIQKGAGNAYRLQAPANALSLYPTHESLVEALTAGEFFADLKLNPEGWNPLGTSLNKANLLRDVTATGMGLTASAVPDEAFAKLRVLISTAQSTANGRLRAEVGTYDGTATSDSYGGEKKLTFSFSPHLVIVQPVSQIDGNNNSKTADATAPLVMIRDSIITRIAATRSGAANLDVIIEWGNNSVSWGSGFAHAAQMMSIFRYGYLAIG